MKRSRTSRRQRQSSDVIRIHEDVVGKTFTLPPYGQNDVLQSYDLPVTLTRHTCPHYFADAGAGVGAGAGAARYLSNQRTMAANIS